MTSDLTARRKLILTATMDAAAQARLDTLRQRHFPPARNFLQAHLTLFHALSGADVVAIGAVIARAMTAAALPATVTGLRFLGAGTAYTIDCAPLGLLRETLARVWREGLTPQDRQGFRPHVTVQNKIAPEAARAVFAMLTTEFEPWTFDITGLQLWSYEGGPWSPVRRFEFTPGADGP